MVKKSILGKKHSKEDKLVASEEDIRWATNELVADWRAERMKCDRIADIGCGIGLQAFSFAKKCGNVLAVDIDPVKVENAKKNASKLHFTNVTVITGDALAEDIIKKSKDCQAIFLDPERSPNAEARTLEEMKPDIKQFLTAYSEITSNIAIEFPPQIQDVPLDCEREYASVNGKLNRLTLYFGKLKRSNVSAVVLPQMKSMERRKKVAMEKCSTPKKYLYEVDPAVHKAGLLPELTFDTKCPLVFEKKQAFLTSDDLVESAFFRRTYKVVDAVEFEKHKILESLKRLQAGKALIRYEVPPEEYWKERNFYEHKLSGSKEMVLFNFEGLAVICENI